MLPLDRHLTDVERDLTPDALLKVLAICESDSFVVDGDLVASDPYLSELANMEAFVDAGVTQSLDCTACEVPHQVDVEFFPLGAGYRAFCPDAGSIDIDGAAIQLFEFKIGWLLRWLATQFHVPSSYRPIELAPLQLWELGEGHVLQHRLHVFFARCVRWASALGNVQGKLKSRKGLTGLVVKSSPLAGGPMSLRNGFSMVSISDILNAQGPHATIDLRQTMSMVEPKAVVDPYASGFPGRPTSKTLMQNYFDERVRSDELQATLKDEAEAIRQLIAENHRNASQPTQKTIMNNIRDLYRAKRRSLSPAVSTDSSSCGGGWRLSLVKARPSQIGMGKNEGSGVNTNMPASVSAISTTAPTPPQSSMISSSVFRSVQRRRCTISKSPTS